MVRALWRRSARVYPMRVEQNVRPTDIPPEVREPEAQSEGNSRAVSTPSEDRPFFPAPDLVAAALAAGKIGVWAWDIASNHVTWSANLEEIHRLAPGSFDGTFSGFESAVHPDDRAGVVAAIKES